MREGDRVGDFLVSERRLRLEIDQHRERLLDRGHASGIGGANDRVAALDARRPAGRRLIIDDRHGNGVGDAAGHDIE